VTSVLLSNKKRGSRIAGVDWRRWKKKGGRTTAETRARKKKVAGRGRASAISLLEVGEPLGGNFGRKTPSPGQQKEKDLVGKARREGNKGTKIYLDSENVLCLGTQSSGSDIGEG